MKPSLRNRARGGFTLAEVAVTLLIMGLCMLYVLQGLNESRHTAMYTYRTKMAREMATLLLSKVEAGAYWEDLESDNMLSGACVEEDELYEDYFWEMTFGDEAEFSTVLEGDRKKWDRDDHTTLSYRDMQERERDHDEGEDELLTEEPFEDVRVRITLETELENKVLITLEKKIPWDLVYGTNEEEEEGGSGTSEESPF